MIGLIILLVAGTYFAIWGLVVYFSYRLTFKATESKKKSFSVATVFFVVMYLIPFWDLIPTLIMHKYYCNTQAGFWVYKTPEDWAKENPGVLESLKPYENFVSLKISVGNGTKMNDRFGSIFEIKKIGRLPIEKQRTAIVDVVNNEILVESIDFSTGYGEFHNSKYGYWKFWLNSNYCDSYEDRKDWVKKIKNMYMSFNMKRS